MPNYSNQGPGHSRHTAFDLSHERVLTCNMGQLIPILSEFVVPGDRFKISENTVVRFNPLIHPLMHEVNIYTHYFFVPYRLLYPLDMPDDSDTRVKPFCWEDFITGGSDGLGFGLDTNINNVKVNPWANVTPPSGDFYLGGLLLGAGNGSVILENPAFNPGSLWDFFRFAPCHSPGTNTAGTSSQYITVGNPIADPNMDACPIDAPWRAYNFIHWQYYRDEILDTQGSLSRTIWNPNDPEIYLPPDDASFFDASTPSFLPFNNLRPADTRRPKFRAYEKDYFTSAQIDAQRGTPGTVSIEGLTTQMSLLPVHAYGQWPTPDPVQDLGVVSGINTIPAVNPANSELNSNIFVLTANGASGLNMGSIQNGLFGSQQASSFNGGNQTFPAGSLSGGNYVPLTVSGNSTLAVPFNPSLNGITPYFDINSLRLAYSMQHYAEVNQRYGTRYTEWLYGHFGLSPRDERLQRPEYIGGSKSPVIFSEVLQTSASTPGQNALGQLGGHGMSVDGNFIGSYFAQEYGIIMGILSVMPTSSYGQGIDKQHCFTSRYDVYTPDFAYIGEQGINQYEIAAIDQLTFPLSGAPSGNVFSSPLGIFGYQGAFDHLRQRTSSYHALMHYDLSSWHLGRYFFNTSPVATIQLNTDFITSAVDDWDRSFAVTSEVSDELVVTVGQRITAVRPMPYVAVPHIDGMED